MNAPAPSSALLPDTAGLVLRPVVSGDIERERAFIAGLSAQSRYFRRLGAANHQPTAERLARLTRPSPGREYAVAAVDDEGRGCFIGVARYALLSMQTIGLIEAEMAAVVTDAWHRQGVGRQLVQQAIAAAGAQGIAILHGDILTGNIAGIALARSLGFTIAPHPDGASLRLASLDLRSQGTPRHPV